MPKQILKSVGRNGMNFPTDDVMTVQYLLNCVPVPQGGPAVELDMDGIIGPKTIKAIDTFQARWFSFVDGRVDPNGQTLGALVGFDPAPQQSLPPAGGANVKNAGTSAPGSKTGGTGVKNAPGVKNSPGFKNAPGVKNSPGFKNAPGVKNGSLVGGGTTGFGFKG